MSMFCGEQHCISVHYLQSHSCCVLVSNYVPVYTRFSQAHDFWGDSLPCQRFLMVSIVLHVLHMLPADHWSLLETSSAALAIALAEVYPHIMPSILNVAVVCLQKLINQPEYAQLNSTEKLALLEHGICPQTPLPNCHEMALNFAVDWRLLEDAMKVAFANLRQRHSTVLDGTDPYHK